MHSSLPDNLYSCEQTRALDARASKELGIAGINLMKRAGRAAYRCAREFWPERHAFLVLCGAGNNGGDGYIVAALAAQRRQPVQVLWLKDPAQLTGDAQAAYLYAQQEGVPMAPFDPTVAAQFCAQAPTVIVDALLGTGVKGPVRADYLEAIDWINAGEQPVLAVDIPSGLCGDTGVELPRSVRAQKTVTFIGCKVGLLTGRGPARCGELVYESLAVPEAVFRTVKPTARLLRSAPLWAALPDREVDAHKGLFGHVLVVGGDLGMGGAAILAAETTAFTGAGLISLATRPEHLTAALARRPELMVLGVTSGQELEPHLSRPTVIVIGPGLGRTPWSEQMLQQALLAQKPLVIDADGLNILAEGRLKLPETGQWVLTPHPAEAARLLGCTTAEIQQDRVQAVQKLQQKYGGVVLLKGAGTLLCDGSQVVVAPVANPALATAGSGDVLSGLVGSLLAQGLSAFPAAQLAVMLHGDAAALAAQETGPRGLLASELVPYLRELLPQ